MGGEAQEHAMPAVAVVPFVLTLLGIAILPLLAAKWWDSNRNKAIFAAVLAVPTGLYLAGVDAHILLHTGEEYLSFICLLGSLYIVAGGIVVRGDLKPSPGTNVAFLGLGSVLASLIGTTGASMLLIRPFLRANQVRTSTRHLPVFFIFSVSNVGGLLTPLGDPPLFLGFLRGVPFSWTFGLWPVWISCVAATLAIFFLIDLRSFKAAGVSTEYARSPLGVAGLQNLLYLGMIVASAATLPFGYREGAMAVAALLSLSMTKKSLRAENGFTYHPIVEVAVLFIGIFITMQPALQLLRTHGPAMGLESPRQFFWSSGVLSSFLDNAPTYLTFFTVAQTLAAPGDVLVAGVAEPILKAISLGSVLMGANTYIGNGPNFMVKSISDEAGFQTPSFFGYMVWSVAVLVPIWIVVSLVFL